MRLAYVFAFCVIAAHPLPASEIKAVPRIVDGDTIYADTVKIRLSGIDAPETDQLCLDASGKVGPAALRRRPVCVPKILANYHTCVADTIGRFNGTIAKYTGDGVLAYFGYRPRKS